MSGINPDKAVLDLPNLLVLDKDFNPLHLIDEYKSLIWTDRYCQYGDFEIVCPVKAELLEAFQQDLYFYNSQSDHLMIIDEISVDSDAETGGLLTVTGYSLEYLLNRRVLYKPVLLSGKMVDVLKNDVIVPNLIRPLDQARIIPNLVYLNPSDEAIINAELAYEDKFVGTPIHDLLQEVLSKHDFGFRITLNPQNVMELEIYNGTDRSYAQTENRYVIFSPKYDNIMHSNYYRTNRDYKTTAYIEGVYETDQSSSETRQFVIGGEYEGLERREYYSDGSGVSSKDEDGNLITKLQFDNLLHGVANEDLYEHRAKEMFEGEVEANTMFRYGEDFYLGDIVQVENEYGLQATSRVSEIVFSHDENGYTVVPTFTAV